MKKILIAGKGSYIGGAVAAYLGKAPEDYFVRELDLQDSRWPETDFSGYDVVFHVAGLAHSDMLGRESEAEKNRYFAVNCDLCLACARKAKMEKVRQFIFMSSIVVYGANTSVGKPQRIHAQTVARPRNFYGASKLAAEEGLRALQDVHFKVCLIRPPMIYGPHCRGNYQNLRELALALPFFPLIENERSMLYITNFCLVLQALIDREAEGFVFPQNPEYVCTSQLSKNIAACHGKKQIQLRLFNPLIRLLSKTNGRWGQLCNKAFGNLSYEKDLCHLELPWVSFDESIRETERLGTLPPERK